MTAVFEIFLSYSRRDNAVPNGASPDAKGWVTALRDHILEDHRRFSTEPLRFFFDAADMDDWRHRILNGLRSSKILLVCLSQIIFAASTAADRRTGLFAGAELHTDGSSEERSSPAGPRRAGRVATAESCRGGRCQRPDERADEQARVVENPDGQECPSYKSSAVALLILDNVSEPSLLSTAQLGTLPRTDWLRIVATTRLGEESLRASQKSLALVAVDSLAEEDALA